MREARANTQATIPDPYSIPLADLTVVDPALFQQDAHWDYFARLRAEDPVHLNEDEEFGRVWSVTRFEDIMYVDKHHELFSSEAGITLGLPNSRSKERENFQTSNFIAMDPPKHDVQRATVAPVVAPSNLANLESTIRARAGAILDSLPIDAELDWVDAKGKRSTDELCELHRSGADGLRAQACTGPKGGGRIKGNARDDDICAVDILGVFAP